MMLVTAIYKNKEDLGNRQKKRKPLHSKGLIRIVFVSSEVESKLSCTLKRSIDSTF